MSETINVSIGGEEVSIIIEGGNMASGSAVALNDLNQAAIRAEDAASDAEAAVAAIPALVADKANRPLDNATRLRAVSGADVIAAQAFFDQLPYLPLEFGIETLVSVASPTDRSVEFQAMLDGMAKGKKASITGTYYVNDVVYVPMGVHLSGNSQVGEILDRTANWLYGSTIILGPLGKIVLKANAHVSWIQIISLDAATPPVLGEPYDAFSRIHAWDQTAIETAPINDPVRDGGTDNTVENCAIIGFRIGVRNDGGERLTVRFNKFDCHNGVLISNSYDTARVLFNQFWGFWPAHRYITNQSTGYDATGNTAGRSAYDSQSPGFMYYDSQAGVMYFRADLADYPSIKWYNSDALAYRDGIAMGVVPGDDYAGRVDGAMFIGNLNYGHKYGLAFHGENYSCHAYFNEVSGTPSYRGILYTEGVSITGHTVFTKFVGNHADSHRWNYNLAGPAGSFVMLSTNTSGAFHEHAIRFGEGDADIHGFASSSSQPGAFLVGCFPNMGNLTIDYLNVGETGIAGLFNISTPAQKRKLRIGPNIRTPASLAPDRRALTAFFKAKGGASGTQTITASTATKIAFDEISFDGHGLWDAAQDWFQPAEAGLYQFQANIAFSRGSGDLGTVYASIEYSGGPIETPVADRRGQIGENYLSFTLNLYLDGTFPVWVSVFSEVAGTVSNPASSLQIRRVF